MVHLILAVQNKLFMRSAASFLHICIPLIRPALSK